MSNIVVEHGESPFARRLRRRRFPIAAAIAAIEAIFVLAGIVPWWAAVLASFVAVAAYVGWARQQRSALVRSVAWIAAASQLVVVLVPVAIVLIGLLAVVGLVVLAVIALAVLLLDRR